MIHFLAFVRTLVSAFHSTKVSTLGESVGTLSGWWDEPYVHHSYLVGIKSFVFWCFFIVWFSVLMDLLHLVLHARLCHSYKLHVCVERHWPNPASPWIISAAHCCWPGNAILCSISGTTSLTRSTVLLLLSSTLNQASARPSHYIKLSKENGKFTCLRFVRGCLKYLIYLALLIRFLDLWFVEWNMIKSCTKVAKLLSSISLQASSMVPAYHPHLWDLSSLEQYFTLGLSTLRSSDCHAQDTPYQQQSISQNSALVLIDYVKHFERHVKLSVIDFPSDKRGIPLKYPRANFCGWGNDSMSLVHTVFETARPYGWSQLTMVHQSIFHLDLFSSNARLACHFILFLSA